MRLMQSVVIAVPVWVAVTTNVNTTLNQMLVEMDGF